MEPNIQSTRRGKIRWLWVLAVVAVFGIGAVARWLTKPLPPPVVSLSLVGFKEFPTNTYAVMVLSNLGPTILYFDYRDWSARFDTVNGPITNVGWGTGMSIISLGTPRGSNEVFRILVPPGTTNWQLEATFSYFSKHHPRIEFAEWALRKRLTNELIWRPFSWLAPIAERLLPEPSSRERTVSTDWLTNLPPAAALAE